MFNVLTVLNIVISVIYVDLVMLDSLFFQSSSGYTAAKQLYITVISMF